MKLPLQSTCVPALRPLSTRDWSSLLRLNAGNRPAVAPLNETELAHLLSFDGHHLVAVDERDEALGYLLSFASESDYDDSEFRWCHQHLAKPFFYICQVVVASEHQRRGIGHAFYHHLLATARRHGAHALCCDINIMPPNLSSSAFHQGLGFTEIGFGHASDGTAIAFLARNVSA